MKYLIATIITLTSLFATFAQDGDKLIDLNYQNPQQYRIAEITVSGVKHISKEAIISISGLREGDKIKVPGNTLSEAVNRIWDEKLVGDISVSITQVEGNDIYLNFHLTERPRLHKFFFHGTKKSEETDLKDKIGLVRSQIVSSAMEKNVKNTILEYYKEDGYFRPSVRIVPQEDTELENHVNWQVYVDKGPKVKIEEINFIGNQQVTDKTLQKQMKKTREKKFWRIFSRSKLIPIEYKNDKQQIITYYQSKGFRDAEIEKDSLYFVDDKLINIDITINEGNKYYIRDIKWTGNYIYNERRLSAILGFKKGDVYNQQLLNQKLNFNPKGLDVSSLYLDNGYLFFNVQPIETTIENDSVDLELRIYEGEQATIDEVIVTGNTKTNDHVVLREIRTLPGSKFSRSDLIRSQREIAQLGYFDPEKINIIPTPNPADGTVDIEYQVVEKPSDQLQLSGGWGGMTRFVGTVGLAFNNFSLRNVTNLKEWNPLPAGDGQRLNLRIQANGPRYQSYSASFTEPWMGGRRPNSFTVSINSARQAQVDRQTQESSGHIRVSGLTVSLARRLNWPDDYFVFTNSLSYQHYDVNNYQGRQRIQLCETCKANNITFTTTLARDNRGDNPQFFTRGSRISLSAALTPPYSLIDPSLADLPEPDRYKWIEYHKWMFDYESYFQLTGGRAKSGDIGTESKSKRSLVLQTRAHFGFIGMYNNDMGIGPFERFSLGGSGITGFNWLLGTEIIGLRGYDDNTITPDDGGGVAYNKFTMELRYPIITEGVATIFVLGFAEAGNNWGDFSQFNPFELKRSAGVGVRIFMPAFGMIGVDYGKGFDEVEGLPNANDAQVHFTIGQQLR